MFAIICGAVILPAMLWLVDGDPKSPGSKKSVNFDCVYCVPCSNSSEFLKDGHLDLGVRIDPSLPPRDRVAIINTMDFWASSLDLSWHHDNSRACALSFQYADIGLFGSTEQVAAAQSPWFDEFNGEVVLNFLAEAPPSTEIEARRIFIHEVAHVLGLTHGLDVRSIMFPKYIDSDQYLTASDMQSLNARHRPGNWHQILPLYQEILAQ